MANEKNLKPIRKGELTKEEAKKRGSAGGKKSAQKRKENKLIRDRILAMMNEDDWDEMILGVIARAKDSDKAFEILRDTIGQKPIEKVAVDGLDEEKSKLGELLTQRRNRHEGQ